MKILLVEDDGRIADSLVRGLEQEMMVVDVASDGVEGYDLAVSEEYDVVVLDVMLPGMSGMEVVEKMRKNGKMVPVLMLTARGEVEDRVEGLNLGADDYLAKPFEFEELVARIRALARRPEKLKKEVLKVGELMLDVGRSEVRKGDKLIKLSKTEFVLLEYLMRNKGRVVSKEQIIANVWQWDKEVMDNSVEVYVGYLRNKLGKSQVRSGSEIVTVRGFGYMIGEK